MSGATGAGVKEALQALVDVIGEKPVQEQDRSVGEIEPWIA